MHRAATFRRFLPLLVATLIAAALVPAGVAPARAATLPVRIEAGRQVGYQVSAAGVVVATKVVAFSSPVSATTTERRWINGVGSAFRLTSTALRGLYIRESMVAYVRGLITTKRFSPAATLPFPAGTYLGYTFDVDWHLAQTKTATLATPTEELAARRVLINGRPYAEVTTGPWTGYWVPIASPTTLRASPLACSAGPKVPAGSQQLFTRLPVGQRQVALTFDLGGRTAPAMNILRRLVIDRVCATVFPTGATARTATGAQLLRYVKSYPELFEVGNHTEHHCNLRDGGGGAACPSTRPSVALVKGELLAAESIIRSVTSSEPAPYWRPPYGAQDAGVRSAAAAAGYTKTLMWDIDTIDWRPVSATPTPGPTAGQIASKVATRAVDGSVVLMHLGGYNTFQALPSMVMRLRAAGLTPTTVSDVLR
jgi:peptidoglycan/xylan/chitin deacetylase (PgdA/CDA1 family)